MRKTYKFSHSVCQGGYFYSHKSPKINNKEGLKNVLSAIVKKYGLIDTTIKVYDNIYFLFFMCKPNLKPIDLITSIQKNVEMFAEWDKEYLYNTVYDLDEKYLRNYLKQRGFEYNEG